VGYVYTDIGTRGVITQAAQNIGGANIDPQTILLSSAAFAGCKRLVLLPGNTFRDAAGNRVPIQGSVSPQGVVNISIPLFPARNNTNYVASWKLKGCPRVRWCGHGRMHAACCSAPGRSWRHHTLPDRRLPTSA
jgi:hypothetical protein